MKSAKIHLRGPVYRYNAETCRYERAGISWTRTLLYLLGLALTSCAMLVLFLAAYDTIVVTEKEKNLYAENKVLVKSTASMKGHITEVETTLADIGTRDKSLHNKFFSTDVAEDVPSTGDQPAEALLGDYEETQRFISRLTKRSDDLLNKSLTTNGAIGTFSVNNKFAVSIPTEKPITGMTADDIVSGFGMRINPFHKALYRHEGIDIMVLRGTHIVSTGPGEVISVKHNSVEAGYGNYIEIDHKNGFVTRYAHLENILVRKGDAVERGSIIATSGRTGGAIAPHLHYEVLCHGKNVDPITYMVHGLSAHEFERYKQAASRENQSLD